MWFLGKPIRFKESNSSVIRKLNGIRFSSKIKVGKIK